MKLAMPKPKGRASIYKGTDKKPDAPVKVKPSDTKPKVYGNSNYNPKSSVRYKVADIGPHLGQGYKYSTKTVKTGRGR